MMMCTKGYETAQQAISLWDQVKGMRYLHPVGIVKVLKLTSLEFQYNFSSFGDVCL
jgi:hypothetical protein